MRSPRSVVLDNEAVQALTDASHAKHRRAMALVEAIAAKNRTRSGSQRLLVPTAVRVEAGWSRTAPSAAALNRLRVTDHDLDATAADRAASIRSALHVSVADAHLGAVLATAMKPVAVITSDTEDARRVAAQVGIEPTVVRI